MDAGPLPHPYGSWRPEGVDQLALVLRVGNTLCAHQAGVYQALHETGLEPDWVAGLSIGRIKSAITAADPREQRLQRLREFWETMTSRRMWFFTSDGDDPASPSTPGRQC